jgi:uncharacterized DUF497 family protein
MASASRKQQLLSGIRLDWIDDREDYGEERVVLLGMTDGSVLVVVYTERGSRIRIISARRADRYEQEIYFRENAP